MSLFISTIARRLQIPESGKTSVCFHPNIRKHKKNIGMYSVKHTDVFIMSYG